MATLKFLKGNYESLNNAPIVEGQILVTSNTSELFVDVAADKRIKIGDFTIIGTLTELEALDATKVPTSRLYYVEDGNILARSNGTSWVQVNKQPTIAELKVQLGLGSLAYLSEVSETNLSAELAEKVNAAAEGNHSHSNKTVLDGITAEKVAAWDGAEQNAKTYADELDEAMDARVKVVEGTSHTHTNKALLDTYTQTEENLADAVAKKHSHTFNETELNKIVEGDKAKWDAVAADHLTAADKTALENSIKDAKKAGTDANTNIEAYKVTNDAAIDAIEEDIAEIVNTENGILAQAKAYSDGKLDAAKTAISAEIDADVKVVNDALEAYKSSNDTALAGVKATADAAAAKTYVDEELGKKVDKVTGKSLVSDSEITKLSTVSEGANKVEKSDTNGNIKVDGAEVVVYTHPDKHTIAEVDGLQKLIDDSALALFGEIKDREEADDALSDRIDVLEDLVGEVAEGSTIVDMIGAVADELAADYETKDDATAKLTAAKGYTDTEVAKVQGALNEHITAADGKFETKTDATSKLTEAKGYTDSEVAKVQGEVDALEGLVGTLPEGTTATSVVGYIDAKTANIASDETVGAIESRVKAIEDDYLKAADKTELEGKITAEETRAKGVEESLQTQINTIMNNPDTEGVINSINEFTQYITDHGEIAEGFRTDIDANAKAIADHETLAAQTYETKEDATTKHDELVAYVDEKAVPADWNVNDETSPAYIKNRPFYETPGETVISEKTFQDSDYTTADHTDGGYMYKVQVPFERTHGYDEAWESPDALEQELFNVVVDGVEYTNLNYTHVYSNFGYIGANSPKPDSGYSFSVATPYGGSGVWEIIFATSGEHTIKVTTAGGELKQLDEKFIPDTIARTSVVDATKADIQALADGQVATNKADIEALAQTVADNAIASGEAVAELEEKVYTKEQTYTQEEVNAAIEAAVTAATEWGSF